MLMLRWAELLDVLCERGISLAATTNAALLDAHATGEAKDLCLTTMLCAVPAEPVTLSFDTDLGCKLDRVQAHAQAQAQSLANQAHNLQAHAQQLDVESTFGHSTPGMAQPQVGLCDWLLCIIPLVLRPAVLPAHHCQHQLVCCSAMRLLAARPQGQ